MKRIELYMQIKTEDDAIQWCMERGLLKSSSTCTICDAPMALVVRDSSGHKVWQCRRMVRGERHNSKVSVRAGSLFSDSNLSMKDAVFLLYEWSVSTSVSCASYELSLSEPTVLTWFAKLRDTATLFVNSRTEHRIGGRGSTLEMDECQIGRRKYHRGRQRNEVWLFGGIVRDSNPPALFIQPVRKRNAATLLPIVQQRVHIDTRIITDGWGSYSGLMELGYNHAVVNHSERFVSENDRTVHTQNIENVWRCLRRFLNSRTNYSRAHLKSYIGEFIFKKTFVNSFETIVSAIEERFRI